jgi:N-acetylglucosaminyl-diphospho-decaprenol L-rhamnosyltransferase
MRERPDIKISIIILNYNGEVLLRECLPSIILAAKNSRYKCGVTVIDNASSDGSVEYMEANFKEVFIDKRKDNTVLCAFNDLLKKIDDDIVILLNNDIKVEPGFVDPLIDTLNKYEDAFLAVPKTMSFDGSRCETCKGKTAIKYGMFWSTARYPGYEKNADKESLISHSASGAFDRKRFVSLGGFDDLYLPGIMEDTDLCFRAYKKGFKCYYQPRSVIYHKGRVSFKKVFEEKKIDELAHRNTFLFMWKNITNKRILAEHILFLVPRLLFSIVTGRDEFVRGFFKTVPKMSEALKRRKAVLKEKYVRSDMHFFKEMGNN